MNPARIVALIEALIKEVQLGDDYHDPDKRETVMVEAAAVLTELKCS